MNRKDKSRSRERKTPENKAVEKEAAENKSTPDGVKEGAVVGRSNIQAALAGEKERDKPMGEFVDVNPDEWNNVAIPICHAFRCTMAEI